ncbi:MAG: hypothetical protein Tsb0026_05650 [Sulfuricaulis sp.]
MKLCPVRMLRMLSKAVLAAGLAGMVPAFADEARYEVWITDQTNTKGLSATVLNGTHGGFIRVYNGADLETEPPINNPLNLDVSDLFPNALAGTGSNLVRVHGALPSPNMKYMAAAFVVSGHVAIIDGATKAPKALFRTTGTTTGRQNHMGFWTPDGKHLILANQNGRLLERIDYNSVTDTFTFNAAATLDLVGGAGRITAQPVADPSLPGGAVSGVVADGQSTLTPNGVLKQGGAAPNDRPNNSVICPIVTNDNVHAYVTLAGGGLFVVDITTTPMSIVAEYGAAGVPAAGCGGMQDGTFVFMDDGTSAATPDLSRFFVFRFPTNYPVAPAFNAPNTPMPTVAYSDPDNLKNCHTDPTCAEDHNRDAHGMGMTKARGHHTRYLHQFDRIRNNVEVFNTSTLEHVGTYYLTTKDGTATGAPGTACGTTVGTTAINDPTPDLLDISPQGHRFYVALRGPFPLTISHAADGSCPGLGVVKLKSGGKRGALQYALPTTWLNYDGSRNISDPHGSAVRVIENEDEDGE